MSVGPPFPLLCLPIVALKNAIRQIEIVQLIKFSLISKKSINFVKFITSFHLHISEDSLEISNQLGAHPLFSQYVNNGSMCYCREKYVELYRRKIPIVGWRSTECGNPHWIDDEDTFHALISTVFHCFKIKSVSYSFGLNEEGLDSLSIVKNVDRLIKTKKLQTKVRRVSIQNSEDFKLLMDRFSDTEELLVSAKCTNITRYEHIRPYPKSLCYIEYGHWVTLKDLSLMLKCKRVQIQRLKLKIEGVIAFLKLWMENTVTREISLEVQNVDVRAVIGKFPVAKGNKDLVSNLFIDINHYFDIKRNDGLVVTIYEGCNGEFVMRTETIPISHGFPN